MVGAMSGNVSAAEFARDVLPVLRANCLDCHDADTKKGGLDLERYPNEGAAMGDRAIWDRVYNQVEARQMPPPKQRKQPSTDERSRLLACVDELLARPDPALGACDPGKPLLRRMTRLEYNNTVRDLLGLDRDVFMFPERLPIDKRYFHPEIAKMAGPLDVPVRDYGGRYPVLLPEAGLPGDNRAEHGFSNRGDAMNLSPLLFEKYVALGQQIVHAPRLPQLSPVFRALIVDPSLPQRAEAVEDTDGNTPAFDAEAEFAPNLNVPLQAGFDTVATAKYHFRMEARNAHEEGTGGVWQAEGKNQIIAAGTPMRVRFGRDHVKALRITPRQDLSVTDFPSVEPTSGKSLFTNQRGQPKQLTLDLSITGGFADEQVVAMGACVLSRKGASGMVALTAIFNNGQSSRLEHDIPAGGGTGNTLFAFRAPEGASIAELQIDGSRFSGDHVLLDDLGFMTDLVAAPRPAAVAPTLRLSSREKRRVAHERLGRFIAQAFRHPVDDRTVKRYADLFEEASGHDAAFPEAMKQALAAVLASPEFLYLAEADAPTRAPARALTGFEVASRLSAFLWASMPDNELRAKAESGALLVPVELQRETLRMLHDPRVRELSECFAVQWLRMDQLYTSKPDPQLFGGFYSGTGGKLTLHSSMMVEALLLFETVLNEDRSVLEFLDADYTWANVKLAKLYGLNDTPAAQVRLSGNDLKDKMVIDRWYRVKLPDHNRGGFMTMAGPLTVTSLPTRTSPVKRGAWLLESIFNRPPAEPKVAFVLKDDHPGGKQVMSVRQRFEMHRNEPACFSCHVRLDPPGFALETFNPIGQRRTTDGSQPINASAEWNGKAFTDPAGFKAAVMARPEEFVRGFVEHLLSYALGRKLEYYDRATVTRIVNAMGVDGYRFSTAITEIVKCYPFLNVRQMEIRKP